MTLALQSAPAGVLDAATSFLLKLSEHRAGTPRLRSSTPEELSVALPHPVYFATMEQAADGKAVKQAALIAWRCLVLVGPNDPIAAVEIPFDGKTLRADLASVNEGPGVGGTFTGVTHAEALTEQSDDALELRLLRISALYVEAVWCKATKAADDLLIPIARSNEGLRAGAAMSAEDFEKAVQKLAAAQQRLAAPLSKVKAKDGGRARSRQPATRKSSKRR